MLLNSTLPISSRPVAAIEGQEISWRRVSHGSTRFTTEPRLKQPQDGVPDVTARIASINSKTLPALALEPEDARLTGMTRSLYRRVMGLNITPASEPLSAADTARKLPVRATTVVPEHAQVA